MSEASPEFLIKSLDGVASLRLVGLPPDWPAHYWAVLEDAGVSCRARVSAYDPRNSKLSDLFRDMADSWKGWEGPKTWHSPEGELRLVSSIGATGNVRIEVVLRDSYRWTIHDSLSTGGGDTLSELAKRAETFQMALDAAT